MRVYVDQDLCKGCKICVALCPKGVLEIGTQNNRKGYTYVEAVKEQACIGCKLCERSCPDFALYIEK